MLLFYPVYAIQAHISCFLSDPVQMAYYNTDFSGLVFYQLNLVVGNLYPTSQIQAASVCVDSFIGTWGH